MRGTCRRLTSVSLAWWLASAYLVALSYLLLTPRPLWFLSGKKTEAAIEATVADEIQHVVAYTVLSLLLLWASITKSRRTIALAMLLAIGHAIGTELLQAVVPHRYFGVGDGLANACGVLLGGCLFYAGRRLVHALAFLGPISATHNNRMNRIESTADE